MVSQYFVEHFVILFTGWSDLFLILFKKKIECKCYFGWYECFVSCCIKLIVSFMPFPFPFFFSFFLGVRGWGGGCDLIVIFLIFFQHLFCISLFSWIFARKWPSILQGPQLGMLCGFLSLLAWVVVVSPVLVLIMWGCWLIIILGRDIVGLAVIMAGTALLLAFYSIMLWWRTRWQSSSMHLHDPFFLPPFNLKGWWYFIFLLKRRLCLFPRLCYFKLIEICLKLCGGFFISHKRWTS